MPRTQAADRRVAETPSVHSLRTYDEPLPETTPLLGNDVIHEANETQDTESEAINKNHGRWDGYDDFEGLPWWRRPSVYWLLGPFIVFTLAFGGIIVPKLNLILSLVCRQYLADRKLADPTLTYNPVLLGSDNPQCRIPEVQRSVASFMLVINLVTGILSAIVAPKLGHLSDRYGRTKLMAIASCGGICVELMTVLCAKFPDTIDYRWLLLGSIFDGLAGSFTAGSILTQSYTSDCTPPSKRAVSMGYVHACLFTGLAFGPLIAGFVVKWTGSLVSIFYIAMGCHTFFVIVVAFIVPESLSKKKQMASRKKWEREQEMRHQAGATWLSTLRTANPFEPLKMLYPTGPGTSPALRRNLVALAINDMIILGTSIAVASVMILYCEYVFDWGNFESSLFVSVLSLVRVFVLMGILPIINYFGRIRPAARKQRETGVAMSEKNSGADTLDIWLLRIALTCDILGGIGYTLAPSQGLFYVSGMITSFGGLGSATIQAAVTKHVPSNRVGQLLGAVGMLHALARVLGPLLFNGLYAATVGVFPQAVFVLLASVYFMGLLGTFFVKPHVHWEEDLQGEGEPESPTSAQGAYDSNTVIPPLDEDQVRMQ